MTGRSPGVTDSDSHQLERDWGTQRVLWMGGGVAEVHTIAWRSWFRLPSSASRASPGAGPALLSLFQQPLLLLCHCRTFLRAPRCGQRGHRWRDSQFTEEETECQGIQVLVPRLPASTPLSRGQRTPVTARGPSTTRHGPRSALGASSR